MEKTQGVTKQSAARPDNDFATVGVGPGMEFLYSAVDVTAHTHRGAVVSAASWVRASLSS